MAVFFQGFELGAVELAAGRLRLRRGGKGPPLLLLHGNPQTHAMWHKVAPALSRAFTVFCPDLRGYGESFKPPATADHAPAAKREMAHDMVELMAHFGHEQFFLAGHDRGAHTSREPKPDGFFAAEALADYLAAASIDLELQAFFT